MRVALALLLVLCCSSYAAPDTGIKNVQGVKQEKAQTADKTSAPVTPTSSSQTVTRVIEPARLAPAQEKKPNHAGDHGDAAGQHDHWGNKSEFWLFVTTVFLVVATGALAIYTGLLYRATSRIAKDAKEGAENIASITVNTERAYVKMNDVLPGISIGPQSGELKTTVKNYGKTPATVTDVRIWGKLLDWEDALPRELPFAHPNAEKIGAFLMPQEEFTVRQSIPLRGQDRNDVLYAQKRLWVFAEVDYIDAFSNRYRATWVRQYNQIIGALDDDTIDNLQLPTLARYNGDRKRKPGEGDDWDEAAKVQPKEIMAWLRRTFWPVK